MLSTGEWERLTEQQAEEIATLRALCSEREHERDAAQSRAEELEGQLGASQERERELLEAIKPFAICLSNDNGDVSVYTSHLRPGDWMRIQRVYDKKATKSACDCHKHERQVCDVCQGVTGREGKDRG